MVISTQKPAEIVVLNVQDDIKKGICKVKYAFRFAITETTTTLEETIEKDGEMKVVQKEVPAWQYEETIDEMEVPLYLKPALETILKAAYEQARPHLEELLKLASTQVPKEISVETEEE